MYALMGEVHIANRKQIFWWICSFHHKKKVMKNINFLQLLHSLSATSSAPVYIYQSLLYFEWFKLDKQQTGAILAIWPLVSLIAIPITMYQGEKRKIMKQLLLFCSISGLMWYAIYMLIQPQTPYTIPFLVVITFLAAATMSSTGSLLDSITLTVLGSESDKYGQVRLFGSLFWGLSSFFSGLVIERFGILSIVPLYSCFLSLFFTLACFIEMPAENVLSSGNLAVFSDLSEFENQASQNTNIDVIEDAIEDTNENTALLDKPNENDEDESLFKSLVKPNVILFFATSALIGTVFSVIAGFLFIYYYQCWKATPALLGMTTPASIFFELPIFYYSNWFLGKVGPFKMIMLSLFLLFFRIGLYIGLPNFISSEMMHSGWNYVIIIIELLHGACFALSWAAGIDVAQTIAPPKFKSTFVGIYCTLFNNAGGFIGNIVGGYLYESLGYQALWGSTLCLVVMSIVLFSLTKNKP